MRLVGMRVTLLLGGLALLALGCGPAGPRRVGIEGTITFKGELIQEGGIQLEPMDKTLLYSAGAVIYEGTYAIPANKGLMPGKYSVKISAPEARNADEPPGPLGLARERLPAKYNRETTLTADVTEANPNRIDFKLD